MVSFRSRQCMTLNTLLQHCDCRLFLCVRMLASGLEQILVTRHDERNYLSNHQCYELSIIFTHLKLWIAPARHNFKWVKISTAPTSMTSSCDMYTRCTHVWQFGGKFKSLLWRLNVFLSKPRTFWHLTVPASDKPVCIGCVNIRWVCLCSNFLSRK